ncbi:hypothetical protein [Legionella fairfieldensis]|uniref:hypothetical protein n=1 Tax=Legionella fairfieldensis TaxID=45064 RepID=UPI00048DB7A5|nr:hypothetical protein [Legionella fairfieldensis]
MNKTLLALMKKIDWQLNNLYQHSHTIRAEQDELNKKVAEVKQKISDACATSAIINPEQEITRLNFMMQQQQIHENLIIKKKELDTHYMQLQEKQIRLTRELKMLEKYQEKKKNTAQKNIAIKEQKISDEWTLQQRGRV